MPRPPGFPHDRYNPSCRARAGYREDQMKKIAVKVIAISGGLVAVLLAGGASTFRG